VDVLQMWINKTIGMNDYIYTGDKMTDPIYKGAECSAVRRNDGKCIRGRNSNMLVEFNGKRVTVVARRLKKINKQ
jgi:hypothetical protein